MKYFLLLFLTFPLFAVEVSAPVRTGYFRIVINGVMQPGKYSTYRIANYKHYQAVMENPSANIKLVPDWYEVIKVTGITPVEPIVSFPDETTTGVKIGIDLVSMGSIRTTKDGQIIENCETNYIYVTHNNVVIRNCQINADSHYGIQHNEGNNLTVEDTEISGAIAACLSSTSGASAVFIRLHIHDCDDGAKLGSNTKLLDSYIHDYINPTGNSHNDALQVSGGSNIVISGNSIDGPYQGQTSAILLKADFAEIDNVTIENNRLSGGAYTLYIRKSGSFQTPTNIKISKNTFELNSGLYGYLSNDKPTNTLDWNENIMSDGSIYPSPFEG